MTWAGSLRSAGVTMAAVVVTLAVAILLDPEPGPAVFGMLLAITLSRSQLERDLRGRLEAGVALPLIALAGLGVGVLLEVAPAIGAIVFSTGIASSVYLRRLGAVWRRIGGLIALPFTALLIAPVHSDRLGPVLSAVVALVIGVVAWGAVTVLQLLAIRVGVLPRPRPAPPEADTAHAGGMRPDATTRLALQMLASMGAAFLVGFLLFPDRWSWVVITALTVALGNAGRADVADKAVQRVLGAGAGSLVALVALGALLIPHLPVVAGVGLVLVALFAGLVLRPFGYIWWSLAITVVLALAQSFATGPFALGERWSEIVVGGALTVLIAFVLLPVRSEAVVRRGIADVLGALSVWLEKTTGGPARPDDARADRDAMERGAVADDAVEDRVRAAMARLDRAARPFDDLRWLPQRMRPRAIGWLSAVRDGTSASLAAPRASVRRPLGAAQRALREPDALGPALERFSDAARNGND